MGYDSDAVAFFTATGITDATIKSAINQLCIDLKAYSLWGKMVAIYPMVGGTATTHKYNLKDSRDLDIAFRLSFQGGLTHSATGVLPNGVNGYADTFINPTSVLTINNNHLSYYSRTNSVMSGEFNIGSGNSTDGTNNFAIVIRRTGNYSAADTGSYPDGRIVTTETDSRGFYCSNILANNDRKFYKNGNIKAFKTTVFNQAFYNYTLYIFGQNTGSEHLFPTNKECSFCSVGGGLTDMDSTNFYNIVQTFQTKLGRQV